MENMEKIVRMGEMGLSKDRQDRLVTIALGSCLGVIFYDPTIPMASLTHVMLPYRSVNEEKAARWPYLFMDIAIPRMLDAVLKAGAQKERLKIFAAGGSNFMNGQDFYAIGVRNFVSLCDQVRSQGLDICRYDVGGKIARTLFIEVDTGRIWIESVGKRWDL
jgi:chemotaxis protein CheD